MQLGGSKKDVKKLICITLLLTIIFSTSLNGIYSTVKATEEYELWWINEETGTILQYCGDKEIVDIPNIINGMKVTKIGAHIFIGKEELIKGVNIHKGIKEIGFRAFFGCEQIVTITLPESLEIIEPEAFSECKSLK